MDPVPVPAGGLVLAVRVAQGPGLRACVLIPVVTSRPGLAFSPRMGSPLPQGCGLSLSLSLSR